MIEGSFPNRWSPLTSHVASPVGDSAFRLWPIILRHSTFTGNFCLLPSTRRGRRDRGEWRDFWTIYKTGFGKTLSGWRHQGKECSSNCCAVNDLRLGQVVIFIIEHMGKFIYWGIRCTSIITFISNGNSVYLTETIIIVISIMTWYCPPSIQLHVYKSCKAHRFPARIKREGVGENW